MSKASSAEHEPAVGTMGNQPRTTRTDFDFASGASHNDNHYFNEHKKEILAGYREVVKVCRRKKDLSKGNKQ